MITVVLSEVFTTKISKVSAQERLKLTTARDIVLGESGYDKFWLDAFIFIEICSPFMNILRLSDGCPPGFAAFAHFALTVARGRMKKSFVKVMDNHTISSSYTEADLHDRINALDNHVVSRIVYISTPAIMIGRILNPELRKRMLNSLEMWN
ncbi:hypothetical protein GEMRC1_003365 [Eukaryota sp. GEM-RC1]